MSNEVTILGGGVAGLAAAYAAARRGLSFRLHEGSARLGGNAVTLRLGELLYDSGAHRLHDRDPRVLEELAALLPGELRRVTAPSRIYTQGRQVAFPFSAVDLLRNLPPRLLAGGILDRVRPRSRAAGAGGSFRDFAVRTYGRTLAEAFLLRYSRKLWGRPCAELSPAIAGNRLKPLHLRAFLRQVLGAGKRRGEHLEGDFYYPRRGIGRVAEALAAACPAAALKRRQRVTRIAHDGRRIRAVEINGEAWEEVAELVSTLPLGPAVGILDPPAPARILRLARSLRFRNVVLVVLGLEVPSISRFASTYLPEARFPFTRIHEPRCRSGDMAPPGKTSLVAEIPCWSSDEVWGRDDASLVGEVRDALAGLGWIRPRDVSASAVHRLRRAYPVLALDAEAARREIMAWLQGFENLTLIGRSSRFSYLHLHDLVAQALAAVAALPRTSRLLEAVG